MTQINIQWFLSYCLVFWWKIKECQQGKYYQKWFHVFIDSVTDETLDWHPQYPHQHKVSLWGSKALSALAINSLVMDITANILSYLILSYLKLMTATISFDLLIPCYVFFKEHFAAFKLGKMVPFKEWNHCVNMRYYVQPLHSSSLQLKNFIVYLHKKGCGGFSRLIDESLPVNVTLLYMNDIL